MGKPRTKPTKTPTRNKVVKKMSWHDRLSFLIGMWLLEIAVNDMDAGAQVDHLKKEFTAFAKKFPHPRTRSVPKSHPKNK